MKWSKASVPTLTRQAAKALKAGKCLRAGTLIDQGYYNLGAGGAGQKALRQVDEAFEKRCVRKSPGLGTFAEARQASKLLLTDEHVRQARGNKAVAIIWMSPQDFLSLTTTLNDTRWAKQVSDRAVQPLEKYNAYAAEGETIIMPRLDVELGTGNVTGHEGRHRAAAVMNAGGDMLPVSIHLRDPGQYTIEYYEEHQVPGKFEWRKRFYGLEDVPKVLYPQNFGPVSRGYPASRTTPVVLTAKNFADAKEMWK
ncbi:MAG: hypothetical protein WC869_16135 [Phycisphaerae bacterium]